MTRLSFKKMPNMQRAGLFALVVAAALVLGVKWWPGAPLSADFSSSTALYDREHRLLRLTLSSDDKYRLWVPLREISPTLVEAVLLHEDRGFFSHAGVEPLALARSAWRTYSASGPRQGGSTITMQLARLKYRLYTRSPWGKVRQIGYALWLDFAYSKDEILEAYLNLVPYGQNIEGVGAASLIYFDQPARALSLPQALALAVIPQSPSLRAPGAASREALDSARMRVFAQWVKRHTEAKEQAGLARMPLRLRTIGELPFRAPHTTDMLLATRTVAGRKHEIETTLDLRLQRILERQLQQYIARERRLGIVNASALLLDYRSMEVRAVVGSANYFDYAIEGQVNGTLAKRSPGSTLKPFIYALAVDQGLLHPMTMLKDAPAAFGPFTLENFDCQFVGPISAKDALVRSRNVPAVYVSSRLAQPSFYQFLKSAGVVKLASERHYGLALALGGGEVTMEELANLYAMLANRGVLRGLRYTQANPANATASREGLRLLSEEASFITLDMLKDNPRPDVAYAAPAGRLPVYWKTGTSWGFRDAWTAGIFGPYVLVVWVGNFNGENNPALTGAQAAAPLFFHISDAVQVHQSGMFEPAFRQPPGLQRVEVCAASGELPNADCPLHAETWFIPGKSPISVSKLHRGVMIDTRTGRAVCPPYDRDSTRREVYEYWPSDLARLFQQAGMPRSAPPAEPDCGAGTTVQGGPPRITSPLRGATYTLRSTQAENQPIWLQATADGDARELYWFASDAFIGATRTGVALAWQPPPGTKLLGVVDEHGRSDSRQVTITLVR